MDAGLDGFQLEAEGIGDGADGEFRGRVEATGGRDAVARHGGDVDDTTSGFRKVFQRELGAEGEGEDVDPPHFFPVGRVPIDDAGEVCGAGAVDEPVDFPEPVKDAGDVLAGGKIGHDGRDVGVKDVWAAGDAKDDRAVGEEEFAERRTDAAGCAGDEEGFAFRGNHGGEGNFKLQTSNFKEEGFPSRLGDFPNFPIANIKSLFFLIPSILRHRCVVEKGGEIREVGGALGGLGMDDFSLVENEDSGHLEAVASEVAYTAALEYGDRATPPD